MNSLFAAIQHVAGLFESLLICALYAGFLVTIPLAFLYDLSSHSHCCNRNLRNPSEGEPCKSNNRTELTTFYLRCQIEHYLNLAGAERDGDKRWQHYQTVREHTRELRLSLAQTKKVA